MAEKELSPTYSPDKEIVVDPEIPVTEEDISKLTFHGHKVDGDEALKAFLDRDGPPLQIDEETNRRILRKIDMHILSIMCLVYGLNYLDKTTLSYASITGIQTDIGLTGAEYSWLASLFYFGYLAWEWPTNLLLQRLPLAKYSAFNIIAWGIVLALFSTVTNYSGAIAIRFFLGVFEAAVTPGFAFFTSQWYTKAEQGARTGIWFSFNGFAQIFGGLVAYGIARGSEEHGYSLAPWKIIFLLTGCMTITAGLIFLYIMPDNQLNARWLTKEERILAIERVRVNQQGIGNKNFKFYQLKEALLDPMVWAFAFYACVADIPNGGISNFFSLLIKSFGYTTEQSLLYGTPAGAVEVITVIFGLWLGDKIKQRILVSVFFLSIALLGIILIVAVPNSHPTVRLAGYYLTQSSPVPFVALLSLIATNIAGYTKKTTTAAIYLIAYCVGNIIGPQTFQAKDAPNYRPAEITIIVCWAACIVDLFFIWWYYRRLNKKKANIRAQPGYTKLENQEFLDLTDKENPEFVYSV